MEREDKEAELAWTGERLVTEFTGQIAIEHLHRYRVASVLARGKRVLDIACGEGYGTHLLAQDAEQVIGMDISPEAVAHASRKYARPNLTFRVGSCAAIPLDAGSVDVVSSFETIEHHEAHQEMMAEVKRVLRPDGVLVLSSPNKRVYSDLTGFKNPFHVKELYRDELERLLKETFRNHILLGQMMCDGSALYPLDGVAPGKVEIVVGDYQSTDERAWEDDTVYYLAIATNAATLPSIPTGVFRGDRLWPRRQQLETHIRELQQANRELATRLARFENSRPWRMVRAFRRLLGNWAGKRAA